MCRKSPKAGKDKEGKKPRTWDMGGSMKDVGNLERTKVGDGPHNIVTDRSVS